MNGINLDSYQLVSVKQFSEIIGQKRSTVYSWAININITDFPKTILIGKKRYYKLTDVLSWLDSRFNSNEGSE